MRMQEQQACEIPRRGQAVIAQVTGQQVAAQMADEGMTKTDTEAFLEVYRECVRGMLQVKAQTGGPPLYLWCCSSSYSRGWCRGLSCCLVEQRILPGSVSVYVMNFLSVCMYLSLCICACVYPEDCE